MRNIVIVMTGPLVDSCPLFWTGRIWDSEYPEAQRYETAWDAKVDLPTKQMQRRDITMLVVSDYGTANEHALETIRP